MRRILLVLLVALLALGSVGALGVFLTSDRTVVARHDGHDDDRDDEDCDSSGPGNDCDDDDHEDDDATRTPAVRSPGATGQLEVHIVDEQFQQAQLTIQVGQTVTFINHDDDEHTATGATFDTGKLNPGDSATVTFDQPGTFPYVCSFHADMQAEIIVLPSAGATPTASPAATPAASPDAATQTVAIDIVDFAFSPASVTIPPGTTVVWTNVGPTLHTVTGDFADSGILNAGDTFSWTFTDPGTFDYICNLHPAMQGTIIVAANAPPVGG